MTITKEQVLEWLKTEDGQGVEKEIVSTYIQNPESKALLEPIITDAVQKAKTDAIKDWEDTGKGKNLREHNEKLLDEVKKLKENSDLGKKYQNLLDISGIQDYNMLEEKILSLKDSDSVDEDLVNLKKELSSYRIKSRDLEAKIPNLEKDRDTLKVTLQESDNFIANLLINNQIKSALLKSGFDEFQAIGLVNRISSQGKFHIEIDESSKERKAVNDYGMTPEDYTTKEWLTSPEGKAFKPNKASGGGALGDQGDGVEKKKTWKDMTWSEKNELFKTNPKKYKEMREAHEKNLKS